MERYIIAIAVIIAELYIFWKHGWFIYMPHKAITIGRVTSVDWDGPNISYVVDGHTFSIKFKRRDIDGLKEEFKSQLAQMQESSTPIGAEFKIVYDANNPQHAKVSPGPLAYMMPVFIIISIWTVVAVLQY